MPRKRRTAGAPFTIPTPRPLDVGEHEGEAWWTEVAGRRLRLSNLDKVFWPEEGYTKGDLLAYYLNVAELMLPYLRERPLTMKRMPEGIDGPHFYEKNAPSHTPEWLPRCFVPNFEEPGEYNDFLMAGDAASLLFVANLGCVEFHPLHSRCDSVDEPDYLFFDLDPFEPATFDDVLAVAMHVRAALGSLGLPCYPKTSGATGMQIYVPLERGPGYDEARELVGAVGRAILRADRERVTMAWQVSRRAGKVFIDHNMNRRGANIAAVYSVRPEAGATVSTPLTWEEVEAGVHPSQFTMANVHARFSSMDDPFRGVVSNPVDVRPALDALGVKASPEDEEGPRPRRWPSRKKPAAEAAPPSPKLTEYARKRSFEKTPEPGASEAAGAGNSFVIQKHNARRLHYDLRLERDGVLVSWAVPKGLPTEKGKRHLAVQTEDHPLEYGSFEGRIPEGEYGAGEVKIYDKGTYEALEWIEGKKVTFRLIGRRHRGEYHLVKTARDWLILLSKASVDEQHPEPPRLTPMLAEGGHKAFDDSRWRFEPKLDGIRTLAYVTPEGTRLVSRTGRDMTGQYPELANLAQDVNAAQAVLDGEIVAPEPGGRPTFERLQQRMNLASGPDISKARKQYPVALFAFDLLWLDGQDLMHRPLEERRSKLEEIVTETPRLGLTYYVDGEGIEFFEAAKRLGLEGMVAKRLGSIYRPGRRSPDWRKVKALNRQDCVVLGWTPGTGGRSSTFGALLLGAYKVGGLIWIGQVGTGFTEPTLREVMRRLHAVEAPDPPVDDPELRKVRGARWTRPELVCEVEFLEMTHSGRKLRAPSFKGLRPDKLPADCVLEPPAR